MSFTGLGHSVPSLTDIFQCPKPWLLWERNGEISACGWFGTRKVA